MSKINVLLLLLFFAVVGLVMLFFASRQDTGSTERNGIEKWRKKQLKSVSVENALMDMFSSEYKVSSEEKKTMFNDSLAFLLFAIRENPAAVSSYLAVSVFSAFENLMPAHLYYTTIIEKSAADDWISHFVLGYYFFQKVEDKKSLKHLKTAEKKYRRHTGNESSKSFLTFLHNLQQLLEKRIAWEEPPRKKTRLEKPDDCYYIDVDPGEGYTATWDGACKDGMAHGKGVLSYSDGDVFIVTMEKGIMNGDAIIRWENNLTFKGTLKNGLFHGFGTLYKNNKLIYKGMYKKGYQHGKVQRYGHNEKFVYKNGFFKQNISLSSGKTYCADNWSALYQTPFYILRLFPSNELECTFVTMNCDKRHRSEFSNHGIKYMEEKYQQWKDTNTKNFKKLMDRFKKFYNKNHAPRENIQLERNIRAVKTAWYIYNNLEELSSEEIREFTKNLIVPE